MPTGSACELVERAMRTRNDRRHPALKHGAYSATAVLPGESRAEFEKLHRDVIAEFTPSGVLEDNIVMKIARFTWREQNLPTLRISERARDRRQAIVNEKLRPHLRFVLYEEPDPVKREEQKQAESASRLVGEREAQEELGELYELTKVGEAATFDGLIKELEIHERLDAAINRLLKQLLMVRGVKSITVARHRLPRSALLGRQKLRN